MRALVQKLRAQSPRKLDVIGLGECSLDYVYPLSGRLRDHVGGKAAATASLSLGGGQVATALCALGRLGFRGAFYGAIGDDEAGTAVLAGLRSEGIDVDHVHRERGAATRTALLLIDEDGERTVLERRDPRLTVPADYPDPAALGRARFLHVDATFAEAAVRAAQLARKQGALVSIDVDAPSQAAEELVRLADLCVVPVGFATALTSETDPERAAERLARKKGDAAPVIVTLGAAGCVAASGDRVIRQPALSPPRGAIDTTACGDTFRAALLAFVLEQAATNDDASAAETLLAQALRYASAAAALKCEGRGRSGCPTRPALLAFLKTLGAHA